MTKESRKKAYYHLYICTFCASKAYDNIVAVIKHLYNKYIKTIYTLIFLIFFIPRVIGLGGDISNYDASFWYPRMDNFTKNIIRGEYKLTYQKYHPGVTMLWTSGTSKYIFEKAFEKTFHYNPRFMASQFPRLNFASIFPLVVMISGLGVFQYYLISKLVNKRFGIFFAIVLSLEPFFLGTSRFLHLSALTAMFMFASFLALFYHYHTSRKDKKYFYISSILLGLGALTKVDAVIALPVNALIIIFYEFNRAKILNTQTILNILRAGFLHTFIICFTFYILFPSMWVAPIWTIKKIISEGILETAFDSSGAETISKIRFMFYPETILIRSLPTFFLGLIGGIILTLKNFSNSKYKNYTQILSWTLFFIVFNIAILSIPEKIKDRYLINLYPPMSVLVALFWYKCYVSKKFIKYFVSGVFVFFYILTAYKYHPVYSFYHSELIGGPKGLEYFGLPIKNRGEFYAQAAKYINKKDAKPEVRNVVLSHREQMRTFPPFFLGKTYANPKLMQNGYFADYIITRPEYDYLVLDSELANKCYLLKTFGPKAPFGYDIVNLYKCEGVTNQYKDFRN